MRLKKTNGKPMRHWQKMADELVMDCLVRAISDFECSNSAAQSLPQRLASERLVAIAKAENPELYQKVCDERDRCIKNFIQLFPLSFIGEK
jgi:hypothetical protein